MKLTALATVGMLLPVIAYSASNEADLNRLDAAQQQRQTEQEQARRRQQVNPREVRLNAGETESVAIPQNDTPCYPINQILLTDYSDHITDFSSIPTARLPTSQFHSALDAVYDEKDFSLPYCVGGKTINILLKRIQNRLIEQGFVTTRVVVQPQDLRNQRLIITVIPGRIRRLQLQDSSEIPFATRATRWFAMPMDNGDILNLRDIEQGLENLKRNPSVDADIQIETTENVGESDVIIAYKQTRPVHLTVGLDDSGTKATGRLQYSITGSWDNLFTLNDLFYAGFSEGIKRHSDAVDGSHGSHNLTLYYSVPWKYWQLTLTGSDYQYHQTIAGAYEDYRYSGKSRQLKGTLSRLLYRDSHRKTSLAFSLWHRRSSNFINDTEIHVQRRRMAGWQATLSHLEYLGQSTLNLEFGYKRGTGALDSLPAPEEDFGEGSARPKIITADATFNYPFSLFAQSFRFNTAWHAQWSKTPLIPQDRLDIGGRYSVRGFDGEWTLSGDNGWTWRNELGWNVANLGQELYVGIDRGEVRARRPEEQLGRSLVGGVLGLRGAVFGLNYDYFVGVPIHKPQGFKTSHVVTGFNLSYRF